MNDILIGTWAWGTGSNGSKVVFGNSRDDAALKAAFEKATSLGFLRWDTAAVYGMGTCETFLGELIKGRDDIYISTKFLPSKKYKEGALTASFEASMKRLGRENADLFWIHLPYALQGNIGEAVTLIKSGRIGSLGISNASLQHIRKAEELLASEGLKLGAVQNHFSLLRNDQQPVIDYCRENGITYYAYMVLEQGALSGHYDAKHHFPTFSMRNFSFPARKFKKIEGLLSLMKELAATYKVDPSQIPVLWVLGRGAVPIVGITKPSHAEKLGAAMKVTLSDGDMLRLEEAAAATGLRQQGMWEPQ